MSIGRNALTALRLQRVVLHLLAGFARVTLQFPRISAIRREAEVARWSARFVQLVGAQLTLRFADGAPANPDWWRGAMVVGNHISWLDIHLLHVHFPARFVAKDDIARWPVIGTLTNASRPIYVARDKRRDVARINCVVSEALVAGECVAVFPEGTTSDGTGLLPFHANLFEAVLATNNPDADRARAPLVWPFVLRYLNADGNLTTAPSYVGAQSLFDSMWQTLRAAPFRADVTFLAPLDPKNYADRRALARAIEQQLRTSLLG